MRNAQRCHLKSLGTCCGGIVVRIIPCPSRNCRCKASRTLVASISDRMPMSEPRGGCQLLEVTLRVIVCVGVVLVGNLVLGWVINSIILWVIRDRWVLWDLRYSGTVVNLTVRICIRCRRNHNAGHARLCFFQTTISKSFVSRSTISKYTMLPDGVLVGLPLLAAVAGAATFLGEVVIAHKQEHDTDQAENRECSRNCTLVCPESM